MLRDGCREFSAVYWDMGIVWIVRYFLLLSGKAATALSSVFSAHERATTTRGQLSEQEEWRVGFVGMQFHLHKALLIALVEKGLFEGDEVRNWMFSAAEAMRAGADLAHTETVGYFLAEEIEKIGEAVAAKTRSG
jgi:hypothetical protein